MVGNIPLFRPQRWQHKNVLCFTTTAVGGVSKAQYSSLNLGAHVGDNMAAVEHNRSLLANYLSQEAAAHATSQVDPIHWLNQQHTTNFCDYPNAHVSPCDAICTQNELTPLAIMTADCLPIVLFCSSTKRMAAIHAGWRGLLDGIIQKTLTSFEQTTTISAWIGPSISAAKFEIGEELLPRFIHYPNDVKASSNHKYTVDLTAIASQLLAEQGIDDCEISNICTYQNEQLFSHRRATHQGLHATGRMATVVMRLY